MLSYERTGTGFRIECPNDKVAARLQKGIFSDCAVAMNRGRGRYDPTVMDVRLP